jgi:pectate lyase
MILLAFRVMKASINALSGKASSKSMKALTGLIVGLFFLQTAHGALVFVDHFNYASGNLGTTGSGSGWSGSNVGVTTTSNSLDGTSVGLEASSGNKVTTTTGSASGTFNQFSTGITSGTVYYSFLLRVNSTSGLDDTGRVISSLLRNGSASSFYQDVYLRLNGGNVEVGLAKLREGTTWYSTPLTVGTVYLIVSKYEFVGSSNNDIVSLWVNPVTGGTNAPTADISFGSGINNGNSSTGIGRCYIYGGCSADLDEVRVGTTWADVTPLGSAPPPEPPSTPIITQLLMAEDGFTISGHNGPTNGQYDVQASMTMETPASEWPVIATDSFDSNGQFTFIDPDATDATQKFYRVRVHDPNAPVAPSIITQPQDLTNAVGNTATFSVSASGTAPLFYQWFFNLTTPLTNGTGTALSLANVQTNQSGGYSVLISNVAGSVTSIVAQLLVTNVVAPPTITAHPQSQTVTIGQTVNFNVTATGTQPLSYEWHFDDVTLVGTNPVLTLTGVTTNDAGDYSVVVSNTYGTATSSNATLTVNTNAPPDFSHVGFANAGFTVTGGAGGTEVTVTTGAEFKQWADTVGPVTIYVSGTLQISGMDTHVRSHKTIIGVGTNATLQGGGLYMHGGSGGLNASNIIIRNLTIKGSNDDNMGITTGAKHIWIDHCTFLDSADGGMDIVKGSDWVTVSWCKFYYTADTGHNFVNLLGASDGDNDAGKLHVTFHHNWWSTNCVERLPSVRYGRAHVYNNYYNTPGNGYCVRTRLFAQCLVENNFFQNVKNPWERYVTTGTPGEVHASNNNVGYLETSNGVTWGSGGSVVLIPGTNTVFSPSYSYTLDNAADVPNIVTENAGAGRGPFAP